MEKINILHAIGVFFAAVVGDILWTAYITRAASKKKYAASLYSSLLWLSGAIVILSYNKNLIYIIPGILGSYFGTWLLMTYDEIKSRKKK